MIIDTIKNLQKSIHSSLRNRLILTFIFIGFLPVALFVIYMLFLSQNKIVQKSIVEEYEQIEQIEQIIDMHLYQIKKEVIFLSTLELMDDVVTEDLDKRITRLLEQKAKDLSLDVVLYVINKDQQLIATSQKDYQLSYLPTHKEGSTIHGKKLYFFSTIFASYDPTIELGTLVLQYNLENLERFFNASEHIHVFLLHPVEALSIAQTIPIELEDKDHQSIIDNEHLIVYKKLPNYLQGWYIIYGVDKAVALAFLHDFLHFILYMMPFGLLVILLIAFKFAKSIVLPIEKLTHLTDNITKTKNFSHLIETGSDDEIGQLSHSFNLMLQMTDKALKKLEIENQLRLERFVHLIQIFNTIMKTQDVDECLNISLEKMKELTQDNALQFIEQPLQGDSVTLYVTNFETGQKEYYSSIQFHQQDREDAHEKKFYEAIAQMISLQLDRILLVDKTMAASKAKSSFISHMSHELRTPLNAIIGSTQYILTYETLNEQQYDLIGNIESSAQYLLSMINDILDMAKIEAGKMERHLQAVNISSCVHDTLTMLEPLISEKDIAFHYDLKIDSNTIVQTDVKIYRQILINLLSNSIKFTDLGSINILLYIEDNKAIIKITDTGIGISQENLQQLFQDFTQVDNIMQKKHKGTGLGLNLSRKMAHLLEGEVELESQGEGQGTTSFFSIPIEHYQDH